MAAVALESLFAELTRDPDFDAAELRAYDSADLLILESAAEAIEQSEPGSVVVIGDRHGALTLGAARLGAREIRVHQDPLLAERALANNAKRLAGAHGLPSPVTYRSHGLGPELLADASMVLVQLPRGLDALREIAWQIAKYADPSVRVYAGGRVKHMTKSQNEVLGEAFTAVTAGLGWRKARVLSASGPRGERELGASPFPAFATDPDLDFALASYGATFGGTALDHGSRLLLRTLKEAAPREPRRVLDLGCGNGVLAVSAALAWRDADVIATDQSDAAVRATAETARGAGVRERVAIHRADGTERVSEGWADLVLLNPPFHTGATVHAGVGQRLIREAARVLAPGGELRLVMNSHLPYRQLVQRVVGPVRQLARDRTFMVLSARARSRGSDELSAGAS